MSIAHGEVVKLSYKDWPPNDKNPEGNRTYSVLLRDDAGGESWYTNYAYEKHGQPSEGAVITASVEQKGKYPYFTDYQIDGAPGTTPAPASAAIPNHVKRPAESNSSIPLDVDTWHVKDINIAAQSAFKAIAANNNIWEDEKEIKQAAKIAVEISIFWDKKSRAYVAGADIDGLKRNLADDMEAQRLAAQAEEDSRAGASDVAGPEHTNQSEDPGFDDDIPF